MRVNIPTSKKNQNKPGLHPCQFIHAISSLHKTIQFVSHTIPLFCVSSIFFVSYISYISWEIISSSNVFSFHILFIKCLEIREIYNGIDVKNENFQRILLIFTENILRRRTISRVMSLGDHLSSTIVANRLKRPT